MQSSPPQYMQYNIQQQQQQQQPASHQQVTGVMISPTSGRTFPSSGGLLSSQSHTPPTMPVLPSHQEQYYVPNLRLEPVKPDGADP